MQNHIFTEPAEENENGHFVCSGSGGGGTRSYMRTTSDHSTRIQRKTVIVLDERKRGNFRIRRRPRQR